MDLTGGIANRASLVAAGFRHVCTTRSDDRLRRGGVMPAWTSFLQSPDAVYKHSGLIVRSLYGGIRSESLGDGLGLAEPLS